MVVVGEGRKGIKLNRRDIGVELSETLAEHKRKAERVDGLFEYSKTTTTTVGVGVGVGV